MTGRRQRIDQFFTSLLRHRRYLPEVEAQQVIPNFDAGEVRLSHFPLGAWSTPLIDIAVLLKAAQGFGSRRILELGSFRGHTARLLAENTSPETVICAVDIDPRHGSAYRGLSIEKRILRKTGAISPALFEPDETYDLIFVDANHDFASAMNDSLVALAQLAPKGVVFWHDYQHQSYFHGMAGVPEALNVLCKQRPIVAIKGTILAMHSTYPGWETSKLTSLPTPQAASPWEEQRVRG